MEYGLIGYPLKHSFSKEIHSLISNYTYDLCELREDELDLFMKNKDFKGINVTIPYKQKVIPYLDYIDKDAKSINAVNTIVNIDGKLFGYNTDILGVISTFIHYQINIDNKNVMILGSGATSNTVEYAVRKYIAKSVYKAYRKDSKIKGDILYEEISNNKNIDIIINTTSVGMYPHLDDELLLNLKELANVETVMDVVYNPLRTKLLIESERMNIKAVSGLYMLVAQAFFASEIFLKNINLNNFSIDNISSENILKCDKVFDKCLKNKINIVLTGMPTCGKTTIAKMIREKYGYDYIDTDELIENKINCRIVDFIKSYGEEKFRDIESEVIKDIATKNHTVIATGGGSILRDINVSSLKANGKLFFINRSLTNLKPTSDRPLTNDFESLKRKYYERLQIYKDTSDIEVNGDISFDDRIKYIMDNL